MLNSQMFNCASIIAYTHEQEGDKGAQKHHPSQGYPRVPLLGDKNLLQPGHRGTSAHAQCSSCPCLKQGHYFHEKLNTS